MGTFKTCLSNRTYSGFLTQVNAQADQLQVTGTPTFFVNGTMVDLTGAAGDPLDALRIWEGGLGIWGAIALGAVGAWIGCRRQGVVLPPFADAAAPGIAIAQAMGRFGNWFNQELFGKPTTLPWGLRIDPAHRPPGYAQFATFQP